MSGNNKDCENLFEYLTYLLMIIFFIIGYIFFSRFKITISKENADRNNILTLTDEDDKIKGFFADFDVPNKLKRELH